MSETATAVIQTVLSRKNKGYDEDYSGDQERYQSFIKPQRGPKYGPVWARAGYIQPTGRTLLAPLILCRVLIRVREAGASFDYVRAR